jgi:ubiquinone/menaquinone biosynthesis C-methylase UbiE
VRTATAVNNELALRFVAGFVEELRPRSLLDTGCGTGRGLKFFAHRFPGLRVRGNDPSEELLAQSGLDERVLDCCGSEQLPYRDGEFDFVVESGMLHHVEDPRAVVGEMLRVARMAVFLSDTNIYGRGAGRAKYVLARLRLLELVNRARRGGRR